MAKRGRRITRTFTDTEKTHDDGTEVDVVVTATVEEETDGAVDEVRSRSAGDDPGVG